MTHELLGQLSANRRSFNDNVVSVDQMGELIDMVQEGSITGMQPSSPTFLISNLGLIFVVKAHLENSCSATWSKPARKLQ
jgi:hypothetical protein